MKHGRLFRSITLILAVVLLTPSSVFAAKAKFERTKPHLNVGGPAEQAVNILISNLGPAKVPPCHFSGTVRADDITPFGSGLKDLVFEPINLVPGESVAIPILLNPSLSSSFRQELGFFIEEDNNTPGCSRLMTSAIGYDSSSEATEFLINRYTFGLEKTFAASNTRKSPFWLGFAGGNANQTARLILVLNPGVAPDDTTGLQCDLTGEVIAKAVPRINAEVSQIKSGGDRRFKFTENNSPFPSYAFVDIPFAVLGATLNKRFDAELSIQFARHFSVACLKRVNGSIQIYDQTGETRAVMDRIFFNYHHFHN